MIINISPPGKDMAGMVAYLRDTSGIHRNPRLVTGSMGYTGNLEEDAELAELLGDDLDLPATLNRSRVPATGHVWNAAVVLDVADGIRPIPEWKNISDDFMTKVGYNEPGIYWAAVNHGPNAAGQDHVHILMNRVTFEGVQVNSHYDKRRAAKAAWELEDSYGLTPLASRRTGTGSRMYTKNDHRMALREGREPRRVELERRVRAAASAATNQDEFVENLTKDHLRFRTRKDANGKPVGYSIQPHDVPDKYWWAGNTLAADLSLPRLQKWWESAPAAVPSHVTAVEELSSIRTRAPMADPVALTDMAHQLSNALAAASRTTEPVPGELARTSRQVGAIAQSKIYSPGHRPPALSAGFLFLQCTDPNGPVGKAVMIQQMLAASRAVLDAHLARARVAVPSKEGVTRVTQAPEEEVIDTAVTVGMTGAAMAIERHARNRTERTGWEAEPFTRESITKFRIQDEVAQKLEAFKEPPGLATPEQKQRLFELSGQLDLPMGDAVGKMTTAEAESLIRTMDYAVGPQAPAPTPAVVRATEEREAEEFLAKLEERAAQRATTPKTPKTMLSSLHRTADKTAAAAVAVEEHQNRDAARVHNSPTIKATALTPSGNKNNAVNKPGRFRRNKG